jgi:hypothetical protein
MWSVIGENASRAGAVARRRRIADLAVGVLVAGALAVGAFGGSAVAGGSPPASGARGIQPRTDASGTVWLCRPGLAADPCTYSLTTTSVPASGPRTVTTPTPAVDPAFDCFYLYPTSSTQPTDNADLEVQAGEVDAAVAQASPFSTLCRVWAPMYRQRTEGSLAKGLGSDPTADGVAYRSVLAAWKDYLAHFNDGRPVIFIGHSQGAAMLIRLLAGQIDPSGTLRSRMVSAIIAGGNVAVPTGRDVGATFKHLPLCTSTGQTSCVIAYSSFPERPPADSLFGRPGQGVSLQSGQTAHTGVEVACVNPAALGGGTADLDPRFLTVTMPPPAPPVTTPWVTYPGLYSAGCRSTHGATWLQVTDEAGPGDHRPVVTESLGPTWGYHLDDISLALGNLLTDVSVQEHSYAAHHGSSRGG